jgi:F1F0 ATPase subunit 2
MNELLSLALAWLAGATLGGVFFGGLWWTVHKGVLSQQPVIWFAGSLLLRTTITLAGFYFVMGSSWRRLLLCSIGFIMARVLVTWLTRLPQSQKPPVQAVTHAS